MHASTYGTSRSANIFNNDNMDHNTTIGLCRPLLIWSRKRFQIMRRLQKSIATALWRRHIAQTFFRSEATTGFRQALNEAQETTLLGHLGWLVARETLSHPAIARNIVEEIYGGDLGKHWVARFIQRHFFSLCFFFMFYVHVQCFGYDIQTVVRSTSKACLCEISRNKAEYAPIFHLFYNQVGVIYLLNIVYTNEIIVNS